MNRTLITPMLVLLGLIATIALMACSNLFTPLIQFIHTDAITPVQGLACILFSVAGFVICYVLLNLLCSYFVPRLAKTSSCSEGSFNNNQMEGRK